MNMIEEVIYVHINNSAMLENRKLAYKITDRLYRYIDIKTIKIDYSKVNCTENECELIRDLISDTINPIYELMIKKQENKINIDSDIGDLIEINDMVRILSIYNSRFKKNIEVKYKAMYWDTSVSEVTYCCIRNMTLETIDIIASSLSVYYSKEIEENDY